MEVPFTPPAGNDTSQASTEHHNESISPSQHSLHNHVADSVQTGMATEPVQLPPKPVASIFTKEGLQKCREQQQQAAQKPKRSRKKEPEIAPPSANTATSALTPPDSAQETTVDATVPATKAKKPRGKPTGPKTSTTGKGKRKKNDEDADGGYHSAIGSTLPIRTEPRPSRSSQKLEVQSPSPPTVVSDGGTDGWVSGMEHDNTSARRHRNQSRRKRRKVTPEALTETQTPQTVDAVAQAQEDVEMEDLPEPTVPHISSPSQQTVSSSNIPAPQLQAEAKAQIPPPESHSEVQATAPKVVHPFFNGGIKKAEVKPTHPFFASGGAKKATPATTTVVPVPPTSTAPIKKTIPTIREPNSLSTNPNAQPPSRPALSPMSARALKIPGLLDAPWPDRLERHVRSLQSTTETSLPASKSSIPYESERKLKERKVEVLQEEDLLEHYTHSLHIPEFRSRIKHPKYVEEEYFRVSSTLRLPSRAVMTGSQLQDFVRQRTAARLPFPGKAAPPHLRENSPESGGSDPETSQKKAVHSGLLSLYGLLYETLTPFDRGQHESQLWTQKYAPSHSEDVLQVGREVSILRDWLIKLMVETGYENPGNKKKRKSRKKDAVASGKPKGPLKRKKKKRAKGDGLDDFLVDSEEEHDEMDEITDPEDNDSANDLFRPIPGAFGMQPKKSAIRTVDKNASVAAELGYIPGGGSSTGGGGENGKMVNAVVISGTYGCGKTAAVFAVAKELGFQVFEVNAGSRRNGKDVLDQVGEMSRTHLVHQQQQQPKPETSFFKLGGNKNKAAKVEEVIEKAQQTQSLILLEEADILYEEDKQFWYTVIGLMGQSKRPIIITCNDERLLPLSSLSLHAILRLSPPPLDLTTDYLLLIAANEGHLLKRKDVSLLVKGVAGDLRAAITQLNFWCQMGVGDRRAGLDWLLQRFPVGCDIDDKGEIKRVVSTNTYIGGMGWIPQKVQDDGISPPDSEARILSEDQIWKDVWQEWGVDLPSDEGYGGITRGMQQWSNLVTQAQAMETNRLVDKAYSVYAEAMSDVDVYSGKIIGISGWEDELLDPTVLPTSKHKPNTDELQGYITLPKTTPWPSSDLCRETSEDMAMTIRSLARHHLTRETNNILSLPGKSPTTLVTPITQEEIINTIANRHYNHLPSPGGTSTTASPRPIHKSYLRDAFAHLVAPSPSAPCYSSSAISSSLSNASPALSSCATIAIGASAPTLPSLFNAQYGTQIASTLVHGSLKKLTCEVAPQVRQIVRNEQAEAADAASGKRNTRASRMAASGFVQRPRRRGGYFPRGNARWMEATAGAEWCRALEAQKRRLEHAQLQQEEGPDADEDEDGEDDTNDEE